MTQRLMVKEPFGNYAVGDRITSAAEMKRVSASHPDYVLREEAPASSKASPKAKAAPKAKAKPAAKAKVTVTKNLAVTDPAPGSADKA